MITPEQRRHLDRTIAKAEKRFADIRRRRLEAEKAGAIAGAKAAAKAAAKEAEKAVAKAAAKALKKGLEEGRDHGRVDELVRLVAKRLERPLAPLEQTRIRRRVEKRGIDALEAAVLAGDQAKLQWWIAPPVRKASLQSKTAKKRQRRSSA